MSIVRMGTFKRTGMYTALGSFILLTAICCAQEPMTLSSQADGSGLPWDWSHEHVVFSQTTDPEVPHPQWLLGQ
jgi:hypothetical protein